jgi:murein DD-endopeptidase MepM/ murein hydrolase activator NlpD
MSYSGFDIATLNNSQGPAPASASQREEAAVRRMASEFEALLLRQLTSSMNAGSDGDEGDDLFGSSGGGLNLSRQLFGEQMADTMAQSGGVGVADLIVQQVLANRGKKPAASPNKERARAFDAARSIRGESPAKSDIRPSTSNDRVGEAVSPRANRATRTERHSAADRYPDAIIISRASDNVETSGATKALPNDALTETAPISEDVPSTISPESYQPDPDVLRRVRPRRVFSSQPADRNIAVSGSKHHPPASHNVKAPSTFREMNETPFSGSPVRLQMFVKGPLRSVFGPRVDPINGRHRFHNGIDIPAPMGSPIGAAAAGRVVFAGRNGGYGNMVILEHADGTLTRYGHASKLMVSPGDYVESGQTIAAIGSTGHSTGPHLHFEVKRNGQFINPMKVLPKDSALARR